MSAVYCFPNAVLSLETVYMSEFITSSSVYVLILQVCLYYYRNLVPQADPNYLNALYGKLASEILLQVLILWLRSLSNSEMVYPSIRSGTTHEMT